MHRRTFIASSAALAALPARALQTEAGPAKLPSKLAALSNRSGEAVPIKLAEREQRIERARALLLADKSDF